MVESRSSATTVRWALWSHDQMLGETILIATRISNSTAAQYLSMIGRPSMRSLLRDRQRIVLCRGGLGRFLVPETDDADKEDADKE
jgi:hypothetical protein